MAISRLAAFFSIVSLTTPVLAQPSAAFPEEPVTGDPDTGAQSSRPAPESEPERAAPEPSRPAPTRPRPSPSEAPSAPKPPKTVEPSPAAPSQGDAQQDELLEYRGPSDSKGVGSPPQAPGSPGSPASPAPAPPSAEPAQGLGFRPVALPTHGNYPPPPGYETVSRPNWVLFAGGLSTFTITYITGLGYAGANGFQEGLGATALPLIGPWLAIGARDYECSFDISTEAAEECQQDTLDDATAVAVLAGVGLGQLVGGALTLLGLLDRDKKWVRSDLMELQLDGYALPGRSGMMLRGRF